MRTFDRSRGRTPCLRHRRVCPDDPPRRPRDAALRWPAEPGLVPRHKAEDDDGVWGAADRSCGGFPLSAIVGPVPNREQGQHGRALRRPPHLPLVGRSVKASPELVEGRTGRGGAAALPRATACPSRSPPLPTPGGTRISHPASPQLRLSLSQRHSTRGAGAAAPAHPRRTTARDRPPRCCRWSPAACR